MDEAVKIANSQTEYMFEIGRKETWAFECNSVAYTEDVIVNNARRKLMVWIYCLLRNYGKLKPIEELEQDVKEQMWRFIKEICKDKTEDVHRMKQVAMTFYTIEYFLNEKK